MLWTDLRRYRLSSPSNLGCPSPSQAADPARNEQMARTCPTCGHICAAQPCMVAAGLQPAGVVLYTGGNAGNPPMFDFIANAACAAACQGGLVDWAPRGRAGIDMQIGNYWPYR